MEKPDHEYPRYTVRPEVPLQAAIYQALDALQKVFRDKDIVKRQFSGFVDYVRRYADLKLRAEGIEVIGPLSNRAEVELGKGMHKPTRKSNAAQKDDPKDRLDLDSPQVRLVFDAVALAGKPAREFTMPDGQVHDGPGSSFPEFPTQELAKRYTQAPSLLDLAIVVCRQVGTKGEQKTLASAADALKVAMLDFVVEHDLNPVFKILSAPRGALSRAENSLNLSSFLDEETAKRREDKRSADGQKSVGGTAVVTAAASALSGGKAKKAANANSRTPTVAKKRAGPKPR